MIKQYQLYFVFLLIIVLTAITSCDYQPTGGKYTDIDSNFILPELYLIQPSNIDTIFVMIDSEIIIPYEIAGDLSKFNKVNIYLNSRLIRTSEKVKDSLKLNFKDSLKQIYNFSIQIVNHSGTGSIADKLNMEGSIFERDWIIKLFDPNELQPNPIKWENIDGSLKLSWDTCTFNEFYCYLAAVTAIACRDAGIRLAAQLLVYPVTDVAGNFADAKENARFPSRAENAEGYFLSRAVMEWFCGHYLADAGHGTDWRVSPLRAKSLAGLAPAVVTTAWFDPLRDEGKAYADALRAAGVPVSYFDGPGLIHGYFGLGDASETAKAEAQRARADFKTLLAKGA